MSRSLQIAIDCHDPHALNRFWADVMQYQIEDHHDQIEEVLSAGLASEADTVMIDDRRAWATAAACRDKREGGPRLLFQQVPEPKSVKNREHIDIHAGDDRDALVARCIELGATKLWDGQLGPETWVTLADPEGNEFCVS